MEPRAPLRKLKTYPTFDVQGNIIYQPIDDPVPIDFDDGVNYEQYDDQEQGITTETTDNTPLSSKEQPQQLRQGLANVDTKNIMLKFVHEQASYQKLLLGGSFGQNVDLLAK